MTAEVKVGQFQVYHVFIPDCGGVVVAAETRGKAKKHWPGYVDDFIDIHSRKVKGEFRDYCGELKVDDPLWGTFFEEEIDG